MRALEICQLRDLGPIRIRNVVRAMNLWFYPYDCVCWTPTKFDSYLTTFYRGDKLDKTSLCIGNKSEVSPFWYDSILPQRIVLVREVSLWLCVCVGSTAVQIFDSEVAIFATLVLVRVVSQLNSIASTRKVWKKINSIKSQFKVNFAFHRI